jgi:hypothetical protein
MSTQSNQQNASSEVRSNKSGAGNEQKTKNERQRQEISTKPNQPSLIPGRPSLIPGSTPKIPGSLPSSNSISGSSSTIPSGSSSSPSPSGSSPSPSPSSSLISGGSITVPNKPSLIGPGGQGPASNVIQPSPLNEKMIQENKKKYNLPINNAGQESYAEKQKTEQLIEQLKKSIPRGKNYDKIMNFILHGCKCENKPSDIVKHYLTPTCEESIIHSYVTPTCQEDILKHYLKPSCEEQEIINKYMKPSCETCSSISSMIKTFVNKGCNINKIQSTAESETSRYKNKIDGFSNIELDDDYKYYINDSNYAKCAKDNFMNGDGKKENLGSINDFDVEYLNYNKYDDNNVNNYTKFAQENFNMHKYANFGNSDSIVKFGKDSDNLEIGEKSTENNSMENFEIDAGKLTNSPAQIIGIPYIKSNKLYFGLECEYIKDDSFYSALKQEGFKKTSNPKDACLIVPCSYENTENEIDQLEKLLVNNEYGKSVRVFMLNNTDYMVSKLALWKFLKDRYGGKIASTMIPYSVDLTDKKELEDFKKNYDKTKLYITKNNNQRQEGIEIHNSLDTILKSLNKYILVQELLQDPYLINGRKINLRVYCLIIRDTNSNTLIQIYQDGFMYYTAELFEKGNSSFKKNITTGYIDRKVYEENPLTHEDFKKYLDNPTRKLTPVEEYYVKTRPDTKLSNYVFGQINHLLKFILETYITTVGTKTLGVGFQIYGADIAINEHLKPMIMEINKGPDLTAKDGRDKALKETMCRDVLKSVGLVTPNTNNKFLTVLEVVNMNNELVEFDNYSQ